MKNSTRTGQKQGIRKTGAPGLLAKAKYLAFVLIPGGLIISAVYFIAAAFGSAFPVKKIVFTGNAHLSDEELRNVAGIKGDEGLLTLSGSRISGKMTESPWIRSVSVRKELPDALHILVNETEPFALLDMKGRLFIVDDKGKMLEELKDNKIPFLPVISGNPFGEKEVFTEAISLAGAIREAGLLSQKNHIEIIARKTQDLSLNIDGTVVKIGVGEYREKLVRLMELEEEIRKRAIPVDYIDLRFANRVVVKAVNEVVRR